MAEYTINKYRTLFVRAKELYLEEKYEEAVTLLELIVKNDETGYEAMFILGKIYYYGLNGSVNYDAAFKHLLVAAMNKNIEAAYLVGLCCYYGRGTEVDPTQAISWFEIAAKNSHTKAQYYMGLSYFEGKGAFKNINLALKWFLIAAKSKDVESMVKAGDCYEMLSKHHHAATMYLAAAIENDAYACEKIADYYLNGLGINKNTENALYFYKKGYENKNYNCAYKLGLIYLAGEIINTNYSRAFEYFEEASNSGNKDAMYELAKMYYRGLGCKVSYKMTLSLLKSQALENFPKALSLLGDIYQHPESSFIEEDPVTAKNYWVKASELGDGYAMCKLGFCYETGYGVLKPNLRMAYDWYRLASQNDYPEAKAELKRFSRNLVGKIKLTGTPKTIERHINSETLVVSKNKENATEEAKTLEPEKDAEAE